MLGEDGSRVCLGSNGNSMYARRHHSLSLLNVDRGFTTVTEYALAGTSGDGFGDFLNFLLLRLLSCLSLGGLHHHLLKLRLGLVSLFHLLLGSLGHLVGELKLLLEGSARALRGIFLGCLGSRLLLRGSWPAKWTFNDATISVDKTLGAR